MWKMFQTVSEPGSLRDPLLIVCLSTSNPEYKVLYSQGRELGRFLLKKLGFELFSSLYSSALPPEVKVSNKGVGNLASNNFYVYHGEKRDYILLAGHSSPIEEQYEYGDFVLSYAQKLGVKELVSFGARWTETVLPPLDIPKLTGYANDEEGTKLLEVNPLFEKMARERGIFSADLLVKIAETGSIQGIPEVPQDIKRLFVTALDISPEWHVRIQSEFQRNTDNAVSKTINLRSDATIDDVRRAYLLAWRLKCKGITVYRYGSKDEQVLYIGALEKEGGERHVVADSEYAGGCAGSTCPY